MFHPSKDAYISEHYPDANNYNDDLMCYILDTCGSSGPCDRDHDGYLRVQALVQFDLSAIPTGSTITSCSLRLHCWEIEPGEGSPLLNAFRVTRSWPEYVTWYTRPTWTESLAPIVLLHGGRVVMDHPDLAEIAQMWVDDAASNYGLLLSLAESTDDTTVQFFSSETAPTPDTQPCLTVGYLPPSSALPPPEVLLNLHPNERGQGPPPVSLKTGAWPWGWPTPTNASSYTWKLYRFAGSGSLWIQVCAQAYGAFQNKPNNGFGNQDTLLLSVDGLTPADVWGIQTGPLGGYQWKGDADQGRRVELEFLVTGLTPGPHTLRLSASMCPSIYWIKVYDLEPRYTE